MVPHSTRTALTGSIACVVALALALLPTPAAAQEDAANACPDASLRPEQGNLARVEAAMVCLLNRERRLNGLEPLTVDPRLERSSGAHTNDMTTLGYFSHHARGRPTLYSRIRTAGFFKDTYTAIYSENLGFGPPESASALGMHRAFMGSDAHRLNMLFGRFRSIGIGSLVIPPNDAFYPDHDAAVYTVDFGRRYVRRKRRCARRRATTSQSAAPPNRSRAAPPRRYCDRR